MNKWERYYIDGGKGTTKWRAPDNFIEENIGLFKRNKIYKILDIGCGLGKDSLFLASKRFFVVCLDISSTALSFTERGLKREGLRNYLTIEHDMKNLPFPDESFDAVISIDTIHHDLLANVKKTKDEIKRVLKRNGLAIITVKSTKDWSYRRGKKLETDTYIRPKGVHQEGLAHHFFDGKSIKSLITGFKVLKLQEEMKERERARWCVLVEKVK